jgi:hypothetical protein
VVKRCGEVRGGSRDAERAQAWTWSSPIFSMGTIIYPAYKVFDEMPEREKFQNFGNSLGGSPSYNHRDRMVVVVVILVKVCKNSKSGSSSL